MLGNILCNGDIIMAKSKSQYSLRIYNLVKDLVTGHIMSINFSI